MMLQPALYLIPSALAPVNADMYVPGHNIEVIQGLKHFVVENVRTARRFLKSVDPSINIDALQFTVLDEHTPPQDVSAMLEPLMEGNPMGVVSEAGCPAVADPGADLVAIAQERSLKVVPLVGPSSILLSLMASGFNGQSFAFNGYLPIEAAKRSAKLREMERRISREDQTQIFIETPYRTNRLIQELGSSLPGTMKLCVACDLTGPSETAITRPLQWWKQHAPTYGKVPAIFLLYK